jgi:hypothetical protein
VNPDETLTRQHRLLEQVELLLGQVDPATGEVHGTDTFLRRQRFSYPLAYIYATDFDGNRLRGDRQLLEAALSIAESVFATQTDKGGFDPGDEIEQGDSWSAYYLIRTAEMLGPEVLGAGGWAKWKERLGRWAEGLGSRPFFFCSPNHEAWKTCTLDAAGRVFDEARWRDAAAFQVTQLLRYQMPLGYWEENRQHGPSMSYNYVMGAPLHIYWRASGRDDVLAGLKRLVDFMARYALPDGSTSGALDGRVIHTFGRVAHCCSVTPRGLRLNELGAEKWSPRARATGDEKGRAKATPSGLAGAPDTIRFLEDGPSEPLGAETDEWFAEDHDGNFHALARRQGAWHLTLSGTFSDMPKESDNIYRLERQSRIDLWHERTGLLIGGGSVHRSVSTHLANLFVDTGYFAEVDFGLTAGRWPEAERATYYPRLANVARDGGASLLQLTFAHAQGDVRLQPASQAEFDVDVELASSGLRGAWLGLPLVIFGDAELRCGEGRLGSDGDRPVVVRGEIEVSSSRLGPGWSLVLPSGAEARLHAPFNPSNAHKPGKVKRTGFRVALLVVRLALEGRALPGPIVVRVR